MEVTSPADPSHPEGLCEGIAGEGAVDSQWDSARQTQKVFNRVWLWAFLVSGFLEPPSKTQNAVVCVCVCVCVAGGL